MYSSEKVVPILETVAPSEENLVLFVKVICEIGCDKIRHNLFNHLLDCFAVNVKIIDDDSVLVNNVFAVSAETDYRICERVESSTAETGTNNPKTMIAARSTEMSIFISYTFFDLFNII